MIQKPLRIASLVVLTLTSSLTNLVLGQLSLSGTVTSHLEAPANVEIVIFESNDQVDVIHPNRRGRYDAELALGVVYTLEFRESGALTKRVTLDTRVDPITGEDKNPRSNYRLNMDMLVIPTDMATNLDFEFPVSVLKWHSDGDFGPERNYTRVAGMTYEEARLVGVIR